MRSRRLGLQQLEGHKQWSIWPLEKALLPTRSGSTVGKNPKVMQDHPLALYSAAAVHVFSFTACAATSQRLQWHRAQEAVGGGMLMPGCWL